jgi:hypothetical protein
MCCSNDLTSFLKQRIGPKIAEIDQRWPKNSFKINIEESWPKKLRIKKNGKIIKNHQSYIFSKAFLNKKYSKVFNQFFCSKKLLKID